MEQNRRFSILPFPQSFNGNTLTLNIVVLPRNQNPLQPAIEGHATIPDAVAFADANLSFEAHIVSSLAGFPNNFSANAVRGLPTAQPANARALFEALANNFSLTNLGVANNNANVNNPLNDQPPKAKAGYPVRKYLPETYRKAFNFTTPRTKAAVTDDSYHCAIRNAKKVPGFQKSPDTISWGKVFAFAMRQPKLATELGMVYQTSVDIDPADYQHGGWLFVDLTADSDFASQQAASNNLVDGHFIKRYAARIPALTAGQPRQLFAPQLFPVLYKTNPGDADPSPDGNFDQLFIESAEYDDGFAKIVHATQPRSRNILAENDADGKPVKDAGIRLGWDDEQILIWYLRQLAEDNSVANAGKRLDAPLGVFGYAIDVRETGNPANPWETLNQVSNRIDLTVPNPPNNILLGDGQFNGELPHQVYPMQLDGDLNGTYWLPMYFANWKGHSMVLPDQDAANVYQHDQLDPAKPANAVGTEIGVPDNRLSQVYQAAPINTVLRYGGQYDFRIRMKDLSGGGPALEAVPAVESPSAIGRTPFKRYVSPNQPRIENLTVNSDGTTDPDLLNISRPLLGYPAVVYTRKYADPIGRLLAASQNLAGKEAFGISDPDVNRVQITVEVETLKLDNLMSVSGKDNYVHLYTTERLFPAVNDDDDYATTLPVPIEYRDVKVLHTGGETNIEADFNLPDSIDNLDAIYLPTARTIRLTMRAVCEAKEDDAEYYGIINDANHDRDSRFGHKIEVVLYRESTDETDLFVDTSAAQRLQGIYMQPDEAIVFDGKIKTLLFGKIGERAPDMIQRLAKQLDLENTGLTLVAPKGERVQFGCSSRIRHTLAPDNSSITFASKGDLSNHWLCCVQLTIDRDWTWDALEDLSFSIERTRHFTNDGENETEIKKVGDIEVRRAASFESLHAPKRNYTRLVFIDAVEPKNERKQPAPNQQEPRFPDTIDVGYEVVTHFKNNHASDGQDAPENLDILLPITTPPVQVPKIASAGIALSPYKRNEKYSATEPRQRFLWIEFTEAIKDPNDTYFARMLHYAPDQLISNNQPEQLVASQDPPLPIAPEQIRVISPNASNDLAGLNAMQAMEKASDSDRHYLLPLPPGLHANADELFGFFTYEFRVGHHRNRDTEEMVWTTAQGRFGRPLRATGIQHPAPTLMATVNRDEDKLWVTAPYATAVYNGRNVTADPPRTELWCLLYAQVRQADNEDFRNILLNDKPLDWRIEVETNPNPPSNFTRYTDAQRLTLRNITVNSLNSELSYAKISQTLKLKSLDKTNKDATKYGTVIWTNDEIAQWLDLFGLPEDSPLSILVVEFLPQITNIFDHISSLHQQQVNDNLRTTAGNVNIPNAKAATDRKATLSFERDVRQRLSPLSDELGKKRILRTSPLEEVPFVCCPTC